MKRRLRHGLVAGAVLWTLLTVACSAVQDAPGAGPAGRGGEIGAVERDPPGRPLVFDWDEAGDTNYLYRIDPESLRLRDGMPLHTRVFQAWDVSADGRLLLATTKKDVRVIDIRRMRERVGFRPGIGRVVDAAWVGRDTAILVVDRRSETELIRVGISKGVVLDRETVPGTPFAVEEAGTGVVLLTHEFATETPATPFDATLAVMDGSGATASRRLDAIGAGFFHPPDADFPTRAVPALAVQGGRATVVGTEGTIVSVDLADLEVTVEGEDDSLFSTVAAWFAPPAHAKVLDATELHAEWITRDDLLVTGFRTTSQSVGRHDIEQDTAPAGAVVLDAAAGWAATVVDDEAYSARAVGDLVLTWTRMWYGDERHEGIGVRAFGPDGSLEWQVLEGQFASVIAVHRGVALVDHGWHRVLLSSVDVETGEVLTTQEMSVTGVER